MKLSYPARALLIACGPAALALAACGAQVPGNLDGVDSSSSQTLRNPEVAKAEHSDVSAPLSLMKPAPRLAREDHEVKPVPRPAASRAQPASPAPDAAVRPGAPSLLAPAVGTHFNGVGNGFSGPAGTFSVSSAPPDTNGDVGPNHYVQTVNTDFAIFNKSGTAVYGPVPINTLWSGFGGGCQTNNDGDPVVLYDPIADRWIISQFSVSTTPYLQCIAVSQTPDPTGAYNRYAFQYTDFPDYPKMGVWPDAYYVTFNMFAGGTTFSGAKICAYDRAKMLAGQPATQQCFDAGTSFGGLLPADLDGARQPPAGSPNYVLGLGANANQLAFWKFHVDWTTPASSTFTGPVTLATAAFTEACSGGTCIPQSGTTQQLDSLADRLMFRLAYRNFGDHESLVVNHSVTSGSSTGVRWYELRSPSTTPSIFQQGTYAPDSSFRWMGSIAQDQQGNMALGFSVSSSSIHPTIKYTGRLAGDAAGTMPQGEGTILAGGGSQTGSNLSRWGDYSMMGVDPSDDCTFWFTTEYIPANGAFNWSTHVGSFKFPGCGGTVANDFSIGASPASQTVTQGASTSYSVTTAVTAGAAQSVSLSVSGLPAGATGSFSPASVTAGGSSTLTIAVGSSTAAGSYALTVTGAGATGSHTTPISLTVSAATGGGGIVNGGFETGTTSGWTSTGTTAAVSGGHTGSSAAQVGSTSPGTDSSLSQTFTVPSSGGTLSFFYKVVCPDTVTYDWATATLKDNTTGTTSTLLAKTCTNTGAWVQVSASVAGGHSLTLTLANHDDNYAGDPTYTLYDDVTIGASTPPPPSPIVNGGFETGSLSGWTSAGTTATTTTAHSGTYAAQVGSTSPGADSSLSQTFTVPAGATKISVWYQVHCPDTVTYDWATATIKDNTSGTTTTLLAKTCNNTGTWVQASAAATAGHSVTVTLANHDDNYAGDPTYTLYDDLTVQ